MNRSEDVDSLDGMGHGVLSSEEVQVENRPVRLEQYGLRRQEGDALELQEGVVQRVG